MAKKYMKHFMVILSLFLVQWQLAAQDMNGFHVYNPNENADAAIQQVVKKAAREKKQVFVQVGGNWCIWCARFHDFVQKDSQIDSLLNASFVVYHLNYSKENKNLKTLAKYSFPQRFGFPVFLILDEKGKLLHTQNSSYLEEGKGYSKEKVMEFLSAWTREALDPKNYQ
ncbi:MAG: thioredoxin family protein [Niabella sp.]